MVLDLETTPIAGQIAFAVLDLKGNVTKQSLSQGMNSNNDLFDSVAINLLYQMLGEIGTLQLSSFRKFTVDLSESIRYIVTRDDNFIYIVAQKR